MKNFFKKFSKIAGYALVYIIITLGTAVGVIFLSTGGGGKKAPDEIYIAPQLSHIYENFTTVKALKVELEASIETPADTIYLALNADLDIGDGLASIETEGNLLIFVNEQPIRVDFTYTDGILFINALNGKFFIETNNIGDGLGSLMGLLNVEIPDLGMDLSTLDVNMILGMLSNLEEVKSEDKIILNISVPVIGNLQLVCDLKYNIRQLSLPKTEIATGTTIALNSGFDYPDTVVVEAPSDEYINATHLFGVAEALLGYLNQDQIGFDIDVKYGDYQLSGNMSADLKNLASKLTVDVLDMPLNLIALDNIIYLEYGNLNIKYSLNDSVLITELLKKHFDIDIPLDDITKALTSLKNGNFLDVIDELGGNSTPTDISSVDLSVIEKFEKVDDKYLLSIRDVGTIEIGVDDKELSSLSFIGFGADASLTMTPPKSLDLAHPQENYLDVVKLIPVLDAGIETLKHNNFEGVISVKVGDINLDINYALSILDNALLAHLETKYLGQNIVIDLVGDKVYIKLSELKLCAGLNDIDLIKNFIENRLGITLPKNDNEFDLIQTIKDILDPAVNYQLIKQLVSFDNKVEMTLYNGMTISIGYDETISSLGFKYNEVTVDASLTTPSTSSITPINFEEYSPVSELLNKAENIIDYVNNGKYYVEIFVDYGDYSIQGFVNYDGELSASLATTIQDINIDVKFLNNTIYLTMSDIKVSFKLDDIDTVVNFVKNNFGVDLAIIFDELIEKVKAPQTEKLDLEKLISELELKNDANSLTARLGDYYGKIEFLGGDLNSIKIWSEPLKLNAQIDILKSLTSIEPIGEYMNVTDLLPIITMVKEYVESKQYNIIADAQVYEKKQQIFATNDARLQIDLTNGLKFYGNVDVFGKSNHALEASMYDGYFYLNYNGLLLKINNNDLQELLVLVLQMLGIDPSILPFLQDVANGMDFNDLTGLTDKLIPNLGNSNPLEFVKLIKSISIKNHTLEIVINGSAISTNERAENMIIQLATDGNRLTGLKLSNFYTGVSNNEYFELDVRFENFTGVTTPDTSKNYVDISGSNEIIKAALNMADFRDFEIAGNLKIDMAIPVLSDLKLSIPVNFKVKIVDGKPEVFASIEKIPVVHPLVYNLNNDTKWGYNKVNTLNIGSMQSSGETRSLYIYYKDGEIYFYRYETNFDGASYEKKLKAPASTVMSDILYYVQWGTGFNDTIIDAIRESMSNEHTINLGNIIRSFSANKQGCTIVLNMTEISGDKNMGDMTIGLGLVEHDFDGTAKNIIGKVNFKMNMPFTSSVQLNMYTDENEPLRLVNAGSTLDFTNFYDYINSYPYESNVEMEAYNGNWIKASEREFTVKFVSNSHNVTNDFIGKQGTPFALPVYDNYQVSTATEYDYFEFVGWYTTANFADGTEFTNAVVPQGNLTLYAKWNHIESSRTVYYHDAMGNLIESHYGEVGTALKNVAKEYIFEETDGKLITKKFTGWKDEDGFTLTVIPDESINLYAKYETVDIKTKYKLTIDTGVAPSIQPLYVYNGLDAGNSLPNYAIDLTIDGKIYQFTGWYTDSEFTTEFDGFMPEHDLTIYAKWLEIEGSVLRIIDNGNEVCNKTIRVGDNVTLPASVKVDGNTQWYLDQEFTTLTTLPEVMGEEDVTLYIRNKYTVSYTYYENENGVHTKKTNSVSLYQGEGFTLPAQNNYEINYDLDRNGEKDKLIAYFFNGYNYNGQNVGENIVVANNDMTLSSNLTTKEANWCKVNFVVEWATPSGTIASWWKQKEAPTKIESELVLEGSSITGTTLSYKDSLLDETIKTKEKNSTCKYSYATTYTYHAVNFNTTGCYNYGTSKGKTSTTQINSNITFYVEWDD